MKAGRNRQSWQGSKWSDSGAWALETAKEMGLFQGPQDNTGNRLGAWTPHTLIQGGHLTLVLSLAVCSARFPFYSCSPTVVPSLRHLTIWQMS